MEMSKFREEHIVLMKRTWLILQHIFKNVSQETATTLRDGADGWTALEVLCHLRDFDQIFYDRAVAILSQDYPNLTPADHEALAVERAYNQQSLPEVLKTFGESRQRFVTFFESVPDDAWERAGVHPTRGHFTLHNALLQVGTHDVNHIEQITRILISG